MVGEPIYSEFVFARTRLCRGGATIRGKRRRRCRIGWPTPSHRGFNQLNPFVDRILPIEFSSRVLDSVALILVSRRVVLEVAQRLRGEGFELSCLNRREDATALVSLTREMSD